LKIKKLGGGDKSNSKNNYNSHHDMEGSKMHHDVAPSKDNKDQGKFQTDKSLTNFLNSLSGGGGGNSNSGSSDDYDYDEVEQQRSKARGNGLQYNADDASLPNAIPFDPSVLFDSSNDDYGDQSAAASSLLLAAELAKLKRPSNGGGSSDPANPFLDKIKDKLSNLTPQTISSETQ
jgi:hypothetical protein